MMRSLIPLVTGYTEQEGWNIRDLLLDSSLTVVSVVIATAVMARLEASRVPRLRAAGRLVRPAVRERRHRGSTRNVGGRRARSQAAADLNRVAPEEIAVVEVEGERAIVFHDDRVERHEVSEFAGCELLFVFIQPRD